MNTVSKTIIIIVIIILAVAGLIYFFNTSTNYAPQAPAQNSSSSGQQNPQQQTNSVSSVSIKNFSFNPGSLTVKVGTTVVWTNQDSVAHQIKSDTFSSVILNPGDTFQNTFNTAGTYNYICSIHPTMKGVIVVTQ